MMSDRTITYTLPDFTANLGLNLFFIRLFNERPDWMQPGVTVGSIYGCFPNCIMNGGRALVRQQASAQDIERTFAILDEYGLVPRLTFTNMNATVADLDDPYVRTILAAAARHGGECIVYDDAVGVEVRKRYGLPLVLSTTRGLTSVKDVNAKLREYDLVVADYRTHKDAEFLGTVSDPARLEVMVNEFCVPNCPHRDRHYHHNSDNQRDGALTDFTCIAHKSDFFKHEPGDPVMFTDSEVREAHDRFGIDNFKIVGRGVPFETNLEALAYYLVRPEYRDAAKQLVYRSMGR